MIARIWSALLKAAPVRLWAMIGAAPVLTATAIGLALIVWLGPWPAGLAGKQLDYLGLSLIGNILLLAVIVVALASARVKAAGLGGTSLEIDGGDDPPPAAATVTTTTTATVAAPVAAAPASEPSP